MSDALTPATPDQPSQRALQRQTASRPGRVTGKLAIACKRIVWEGEELDVAAKAAGLTTRAVRIALERPHVIAWVKAEREVFRAHVASQNIHVAKHLRDNGKNENARVNAMKFIEQLSDDPLTSNGTIRAPGFQIVINTGNSRPTIDVTPKHSPPKGTLSIESTGE